MSAKTLAELALKLRAVLELISAAASAMSSKTKTANSIPLTRILVERRA